MTVGEGETDHHSRPQRRRQDDDAARASWASSASARARSGSTGKDMIERAAASARPHAGIGFVPEERGIFATLTVEENLMLPPVVAKGGMSLDEIYELFPNLARAPLEPRHEAVRRRAADAGHGPHPAHRRQDAAARRADRGLAPVIVQRIGEVLTALKQRGMTVLLVEQNFRFASKHRRPLLPDGARPDGDAISR